jgi:hypothetical protein
MNFNRIKQKGLRLLLYLLSYYLLICLMNTKQKELEQQQKNVESLKSKLTSANLALEVLRQEEQERLFNEKINSINRSDLLEFKKWTEVILPFVYTQNYNRYGFMVVEYNFINPFVIPSYEGQKTTWYVRKEKDLPPGNLPTDLQSKLEFKRSVYFATWDGRN